MIETMSSKDSNITDESPRKYFQELEPTARPLVVLLYPGERGQQLGQEMSDRGFNISVSASYQESILGGGGVELLDQKPEEVSLPKFIVASQDIPDLNIKEMILKHDMPIIVLSTRKNWSIDEKASQFLDSGAFNYLSAPSPDFLAISVFKALNETGSRFGDNKSFDKIGTVERGGALVPQG